MSCLVSDVKKTMVVGNEEWVSNVSENGEHRSPTVTAQTRLMSSAAAGLLRNAIVLVIAGSD